MKKRILFTMPSMFMGGAERSLLGLLDAIDYKKYDVELFLYRHEGEFLEFINPKVTIIPEINKYKTFDVPIVSLIKSKLYLFGISRIISKIFLKLHCLLSKEKEGVWMHMQYTSRFLQWILPNIPGEYDCAISFLGVSDVLVNKINAKTKIAWIHTDYDTLNPSRRYDRLVYSKIDYIANVSDDCTRKFLKYYPEFISKSITIENILSSKFLEFQSKEKITDFKENSIIILSIGRFCEAKNFDNVPAICKLIREKGLNIKWYLIGFGTDEEIIRSKIKEFDMEDNVIILGKKINPYPYIKNCDLYVQPSRYEGKAVTVREAQMLCKPVVITKFATSSSQLKDGYDGIIVPMDNQGCADGIAKLLNNKVLMQQLSENCAENDYSNSQEINKIYEIIENS